MAVSLQSSGRSLVHSASSLHDSLHVLVEPCYQYTALSEGCIRILLLLSETPNSAVCCSLRTVNLSGFHDMTGIASSPELRMYEALSYMWGDPTKTTCISCDGGALRITSSLESLLRRFDMWRKTESCGQMAHASARTIWMRGRNRFHLWVSYTGKPGRYSYGWVKMMSKRSDGKRTARLESYASSTKSSFQRRYRAEQIPAFKSMASKSWKEEMMQMIRKHCDGCSVESGSRAYGLCKSSVSHAMRLYVAETARLVLRMSASSCGSYLPQHHCS
jgi:hypothetical protein